MKIYDKCCLENGNKVVGYRCYLCDVVASKGEKNVPSGWKARLSTKKDWIGSSKIAVLFCHKCARKAKV